MKECVVACSHEGNCRQVIGARAETWLAWARAKSVADPPAMPSGQRGFPTGSEKSCRCRRGRGETGFARDNCSRKAANTQRLSLSLNEKFSHEILSRRFFKGVAV